MVEGTGFAVEGRARVMLGGRRVWGNGNLGNPKLYNPTPCANNARLLNPKPYTNPKPRALH
jgi:hypothetical protein